MDMPPNQFKLALREPRARIGLWLGLANPYSTELCAGAGFDWLLIDSEHAPNDLRLVLGQLQAIAAYPSQPVVRPVVGDVNLIKQLLDIGAQNLLIPMVETAEQARQLVRATRYPPAGIRGVGSSLARASRFNRIPGYLHEANAEVCLLLQIETLEGVRNLREIAAVEGVDGVFIGPSDLCAALGHLGNPAHPEVQAVIEEAIGVILAAGKAPGILMADQTLAHRYIELGCRFVAVGTDVTILMRGTDALRQAYVGTAESSAKVVGTTSVY